VNRALVQGLLGLLVERMMPAAAWAGGGERDERACEAAGAAGGKIGPWHRDRLAVVYVRQSTAA
jgi:hypothetical protein